MSILKDIRSNEKVRHEWEEILGGNLLHNILGKEYLEEVLMNVENEWKKGAENYESLTGLIEHGSNEDLTFYPFYCRIQSHIDCEMKRLVDKYAEMINFVSLKDISNSFIEGIRWSTFRCILHEMSNIKRDGGLAGDTPKYEYEYYIKEYLKKPEYQEYLYTKYPVMTVLILKKKDALIKYIDEVLIHLKIDKTNIESVLCAGKEFKTVTKIKMGLSDEHQMSKTVVMLELDNGHTIFYKPRSLASEMQYYDMFNWLSENCGMSSYKKRILDFGEYGWEVEVNNCTCYTLDEVYRYYLRMGIHLFLAYVFSISDLHYDNVISDGEYPVFVDLEFFPGRRRKDHQAINIISELIADSVLNTAILPGQQWGDGTVNLGALGSTEKQKSPFKMPVIQNKKTSEMFISYDYITLDCSKNVPNLNGEKINTASYAGVLAEGFQKAYTYVLKHMEEFGNRSSAIFSLKSRYILRHTQQYKMYQIAASFPTFMKEAEARMLMLCRMSDGLSCCETYKNEIIRYEVESTMKEIIPIYYGSGRDLILGNGVILKDYFRETLQEQVEKNMDHLSDRDLLRQQKFIKLSMYTGYQAHYPNQREMNDNRKEYITSRKIADSIIADMEADTNWIGIKYFENGWRFDSVGMYLYDGICGIAIFMMAMAEIYGDNQYKNICEKLTRKMFNYTEGAQENLRSLQSRKTGIFNGESSIIYTYLILNSISGKAKFLTYAKKHAQIVIHLLMDDKLLDVLEGASGAIISFIHLFTLTQDHLYLDMAEKAAGLLMEKAEVYKEGIGWTIPGQHQPLAGMAHGSSGIALAFARLWEVTRKNVYYNLIINVLNYEDTLYDRKIKNWLDVRGKIKKDVQEGQDTVAWCHGAGGLLLARSSIYKILGKDVDAEIKLQQALEKLISTQRKGLCLCHGMTGNMEAVKYYRDLTGDIQKDDHNIQLSALEWNSMEEQEKYQPGFMVGLSGLGYALLRCERNQLPNVLIMDI